jgi:hypothetical protein
MTDGNGSQGGQSGAPAEIKTARDTRKGNQDGQKCC